MFYSGSCESPSYLRPMNANKVVLGSLLAVAVIVAAISGYRYVERTQTEERLIGTWAQEDPFATFQADAGNADDAPSQSMSSAQDMDDDEDGQRVPIEIPGLAEGLGQAISIRTTMTFQEDGSMTITTGDKDSKGRWVLSQANGKKKTVVARVMQTPTFEQRLVIHFVFDGKDRIIVSDEAGVEGAFDRVDD